MKRLTLLAIVMAVVLTGAIMAVKNDTKKIEAKYQTQVKELEHRTKLEQHKQVEEFKRQIELKDKQYKELEQSKAAEKARLAAVEASKTSVVQKAVNYIATPAQAATGDAKMFIYMHESGNNPAAVNKSSGACGLGQALPCSKMPCNLSDYACQDSFFTQYMLSRYGSWENAQSWWLSHGWW